MDQKAVAIEKSCFHCGEHCEKNSIIAQDKIFCCEGCRMVYGILNQAELCDYYELSVNPGRRATIPVRNDMFKFLDDDNISRYLVSYSDETQTHITFHLPQIHCSSCLWLIENLHRLNKGIISSRVSFAAKEANIIFDNRVVTLREIAELLTRVGYEPHISLNDIHKTVPQNKHRELARIGVAGFCFANIMLLSFPEYLGIDIKGENLVGIFRYLSLMLSVPVVFFSASALLQGAWISVTNKFLNIDGPISLAVLVTFGRSIYEIVSGTGSGYLDSMSGIIFFMLIGRALQNKTYEQLKFDRDYTSYFPVAVTKIVNSGGVQAQQSVMLPDIKLNDTLLVHNQELIAADGILTMGTAFIDYSFVTGESLPVKKEMGEIVYAGGRQIGTAIQILIIKEVAQSYLTRLWNREEMKEQQPLKDDSFVGLLSRYFGWITLGIAGAAALYWWIYDPSLMWKSATAVLIVACPCALLLSNTFTNGNILRVLSRNKFYLRNAKVIEKIAAADHIVFDKTGTLTTRNTIDLKYVGRPLTSVSRNMISKLAAQSLHPLGKALASHLSDDMHLNISEFTEFAGHGINACINGKKISVGSAEFVLGAAETDAETSVYVSIDDQVLGKFIFKNHYRDDIHSLIAILKKEYSLSVLSGDSGGEKYFLENLLGRGSEIRFHQKPDDKLEVIKSLQAGGKQVIMIGDGLNDAGALRQADIGIAVSDNNLNFTPASDAIIDAEKLFWLPWFIRLCKINNQIVVASFLVSVVYNIVGIYYSINGSLSPIIAAVLMPLSSISILIIAFGASNLAARYLRLS